MESGSQMTLEQFMPEIFQQPTRGVSDSHARISASQEDKSGFTETVQACFSELCTWLDKSRKQRNPLTCSLRMLRICLVLMEDGISPDFSLKWTGGVRCTMADSQFKRFRSRTKQRACVCCGIS